MVSLCLDSSNRLFTIQQHRHLLERPTLRLDEKEPDAQHFDDENDNVNKVELPVDTLQADRVDVLIEDL